MVAKRLFIFNVVHSFIYQEIKVLITTSSKHQVNYILIAQVIHTNSAVFVTSRDIMYRIETQFHASQI
jgi:hypothetical protein